MLKTFEDGSTCILEENYGTQVWNIRLGFNLDFIDKLVLTDGTIVQNMQYSPDAQIPTSGELIQRLRQSDDSSYVTKLTEKDKRKVQLFASGLICSYK